MTMIYIGLDIGAGATVTRPKTKRGRVRVSGSPPAVAVFIDDQLLTCDEHCCPFEATQSMTWIERVLAAAEWIDMYVSTALAGARASNPKVGAPDTEIVVGYECPPFMNSAKVHHILSFASGIYAARAMAAAATAVPNTRAAVRVVFLTPTQGKAALCGDGHAKKEDMILCLKRQFGLTKTEHAADAVGIALAAAAEHRAQILERQAYNN